MNMLNIGCGSTAHPEWTNIDIAPTAPHILQWDIRKGLPFENDSFDVVYHSHVLEHLTPHFAKKFLHDCHRVLRPGGLLRVAVPDLEQIVRCYLTQLEGARAEVEGAADRYDWIILELLDQLVRHFSGGEMLRFWRQHPVPALEFVLGRTGSEARNAISALRQHQSTPSSGQEPSAAQVGVFRLSGEVHQWMYDSFSLGRLLHNTGFINAAPYEPGLSAIPDFSRYGLEREDNGSIRKPDSLFMEAKKPTETSQATADTTSNQNVATKSLTNRTLPRNTPKIVHVCMQDYGGAGTAALRLHQSLLGLGANSHMYVFHTSSAAHNIHIIPSQNGDTTYPHGTLPNTLHSTGLDRAFSSWMALLKEYPNRQKFIECFSDTNAFSDTSDWHELQNADIVNLHWVAGTLDIGRSLQLRERPIVWTLHDLNPFTGGCHYSGPCLNFMQQCGACPMLGSSNSADLSHQIFMQKNKNYGGLDLHLVAPSGWISGLAKQSTLFHDRPHHIIPNGLDTDTFKPYPTNAVRDGLSISENAFLVAFCAANPSNLRKGYSYLQRALSILATEHPQLPIEVLIIGEASSLPALPFPVHATGYISNEQHMALLYSAADVFALPSLEDNQPSVMLEALACGTPVVAFNIGGIPECVHHRKTGWLAEPKSPQSLAHGLLWAYSTKIQGKPVGQLCRDDVIAQYDSTLQAKRYLEIYRSLC